MAVSLNITAQVPAVPHKSPNRARAIYMPDTAHPVSRFLMSLSRSDITSPVLMSSNLFSTLERWFTGVRLLGSYLTCFPCLFLRRSRQGLLTHAAEGGLRPAPVGRPRRVDSSISHAASHAEDKTSYILRCCSTLKSVHHTWFGRSMFRFLNR